ECILAEQELSQLRRLRDDRGIPPRLEPVARTRTGQDMRHHVRRGDVVAMPPADHRRSSDRRWEAGFPYPRPEPNRGSNHYPRSKIPAGWRCVLSGRCLNTSLLWCSIVEEKVIESTDRPSSQRWVVMEDMLARGAAMDEDT